MGCLGKTADFDFERIPLARLKLDPLKAAARLKINMFILPQAAVITASHSIKES